MKSFYRYLIPSVIASIFMSTYAIIDGMFIGQSVGDIGLSAINIAWPITSFLQCLGGAIGLSGGIYISRLIGENKNQEANKLKLTTILIILILSIIIGLLLYFISKPLLALFGAEGICLEYGYRYLKIILIGSAFQMLGMGLIPLLKNSNKVAFAMIGSLSSIGVNLFLDYIFIMVLKMELEGAALASVIAQASAFLVCIIPYIKELKGVLVSKVVLKTIFTGSIAPFILNFSYSIIIIITNILCLKYGGNEAVAAYTLLSYLSYIISAAATGVGDSIQPLFSYYYAKKDFNMNYKMLKKCFVISIILCSLITIFYIIFNKQLKDLYNLSEISSRYYQNAILYYFIGFILISIIKIICSYLYSIEDKLKANVLTLSEAFIFTPLAFLILCPILNLDGVWTGYLFVQVGLLILGSILIIKKVFQDKKRLF